VGSEFGHLGPDLGSPRLLLLCAGASPEGVGLRGDEGSLLEGDPGRDGDASSRAHHLTTLRICIGPLIVCRWFAGGLHPVCGPSFTENLLSLSRPRERARTSPYGPLPLHQRVASTSINTVPRVARNPSSLGCLIRWRCEGAHGVDLSVEPATSAVDTQVTMGAAMRAGTRTVEARHT
jgi:hypothetical protein